MSENKFGIPVSGAGKDREESAFSLDNDAPGSAFSSAEDSFVAREQGKTENNKKKTTAIVAASLLAASLLGGTLVVADPFHWNLLGGSSSSAEDNKADSSVNDGASAAPSVDPNDPAAKPDRVADDFYKDKELIAGTPEWQKNQTFDNAIGAKTDENGKVDAASGPSPEFVGEVLDTAKSSNGGSTWSAAGVLPSEAAGATSDISKATNPDGSLNTMFSYWTQENFSFELYTKVAQLLNPSFGRWATYQYSYSNANQNFKMGAMGTMFTPDFLKAHEGQPYGEWFPVYADWGANDYGMGDQLLTDGPRWYGEVVSDTIEFTYNEQTLQYEAQYEADVQFVAWKQDQTTTEKTGHLSLHLVSGADLGKDSFNRVLVSDAKLTVN